MAVAPRAGEKSRPQTLWYLIQQGARLLLRKNYYISGLISVIVGV